MIRLTQMRLATSLAAAMIAGALVSGVAVAQQPSAPAAKSAPVPKTATTTTTSTEPSAWDKTKDMTRKEWAEARVKWAMEKDKWKGCTAKSKEQKLRGTERWTFIGHCMTD